jgi:hypothetical protein
MLAEGASSPAVAALLGLGATGVGGAVVAMAWSVHVHQIRLAEQLARRQLIVTQGTAAEQAPPAVPSHVPAVHGHGSEAAVAKAPLARDTVPKGAVPEARATNGARTARLTIEGPETVLAGEQARYRVRPLATAQQVVTWAAGGGSVYQAPDPTHPDELLLIADEPGNLMVSVRVREGLTERRETKSVTAVPDVTEVSPPFTLRLFLHGWGLVALAVVIVGFAAALVALGNLSSSDFIALVVPLAALVGVMAFARGSGDVPSLPGRSRPPHPAARRADPPDSAKNIFLAERPSPASPVILPANRRVSPQARRPPG